MHPYIYISVIDNSQHMEATQFPSIRYMDSETNHCMVINWPDFNIVVSQGIGPRRGREMGKWVVGRSH